MRALGVCLQFGFGCKADTARVAFEFCHIFSPNIIFLKELKWVMFDRSNET